MINFKIKIPKQIQNLKWIRIISVFFLLLILLSIFLLITAKLSQELKDVYSKNKSVIINDRFEKSISYRKNSSDFYSEYLDQNLTEFEALLIQKEDKYFYYHLGFNPFSIGRAVFRKISGDTNLASSTITQQLVKILLKNETKRTYRNKLVELFYSISLEVNTSKKDILKMYLNSVYFGYQLQGIKLSSLLYFDKAPENLTEEEMIKLLATIESPSTFHPFSDRNLERSKRLAAILDKQLEITSIPPDQITFRMKKFYNKLQNNLQFESDYFAKACESVCKLSFDSDLNETARNILKKNLMLLSEKNVSNGAVVIIKIPENEILSIVGTPDPFLNASSAKINMAFKPRPIGSTLKPFIYLKAFEDGLRPYTLVDDKEYRYIIDSGFAFYPKNYDYKYHGIVNLHYALSNSLNVPTVKVLEYVGGFNFRKFLLDDLEIPEVQPMTNYGLGLALGQLEMNLVNLSYIFTLFPNQGELKPLKVSDDYNVKSKIPDYLLLKKKIADKKYIELINKILTDRNTGIDQFGMKSSLNFPGQNVALKTGTSREFHDSFVVGFTPDFLVAVWLGNADNTPMDEVSGQTGAGMVFQEVMNVMLNSKYNNKTNFKFESIKDFNNDEALGIEYGLAEDDYAEMRKKLVESSLILAPHNLDVFLLENETKIPLKCSEECSFFEGNNLIFKGTEGTFIPSKTGEYKLKAVSGERVEEIKIIIN